MGDVTIKFGANSSYVIKSLQEITAAGKSAGKKLGKSFAQGGNTASRAVVKLRSEVEAAGQKMRSLRLSDMFMGAEAFMSLAVRAGQAFSGLMRPAMEMEQLAVGFETLMGSADAAERHLANLSKYAAETPFDISGIATASKTLLGFGVEADKSMDVLRRLGDVAAVTGSSVEDLARVYGKVATVGTLDTVAIDMLSERGLNMRELIAARDGISVQQVQKNIQNRRYGLADLDYALKVETSNGGKFFEGAIKQSKTLSGQVAILGDQLYQLKVQLGEEMADGMRSAVQYITKELPAIYEELRPTVVMLAEGLKLIAAHLPEILAAMNRMGKMLMIFGALKGAVAGAKALHSAWRVAGAGIAVVSANVAKLGKGLSAAALASKGLRVALSGIAKVGLGPVGWALTAAEVGMFAWGALGGRGKQAPAPAAARERDYSGKNSAELADEMTWQRIRKQAATNSRSLIDGNNAEERLQKRIDMLKEHEREMPRLADAWGKAVDRELAEAVEAAAAKTKKEIEGVSKWAEDYRKFDKERRELLDKHHADMDTEGDRAWRKMLQEGNVDGLVASLRDTAAMLGHPADWATPREGVEAMEEARRKAALAGDTAASRALDENIKTLRVLAERSEAKAESAARAREAADVALQRARLTLAGDARGLARLEDRQRAVALATQYRDAGMPPAEAERRAAELVAAERAAAAKPAAGGVALITGSKVAVGGGGVSLRLNDAQLELSRKSVKLQEQQTTLLGEIRDFFSRRGTSELIPVVP